MGVRRCRSGPVHGRGDGVAWLAGRCDRFRRGRPGDRADPPGRTRVQRPAAGGGGSMGAVRSVVARPADVRLGPGRGAGRADDRDRPGSSRRSWSRTMSNDGGRSSFGPSTPTDADPGRACRLDRRTPGPRRLGPDRRTVRRRRRSWPDRQGRAGPTRRLPGDGRPRRHGGAPAPRPDGPGEHDLRVHPRRVDVPRRDPGAARPDRRPRVRDDRHRGFGAARPGPRGRRADSPPPCWPARRSARSTRSWSTPCDPV